MVPISQTKRRSSEILQGISIFVIGGGIGWLAGLSVSPVIATVLASLVGIGAGIVTGLRSIVTDEKRESNRVSNYREVDARPAAQVETRFQFRKDRSNYREVDARPAALLVVGIALAAPLGIMARTHQIFAPEIKPETANSGTGRTASSTDPVLFAVRLKQCELLLDQASSPNEQVFRNVLANTGTWGKELESNISDTATLKRIIKSLCASD